MTGTRALVAYAAAAVVMFAIDMVWLRGIAMGWYQQGIGHLMAPQAKLWAAALFYLVYPAGLVLLAVTPGMAAESIGRTALLAAAFGFFAYATYDLTNLATLKDWPVSLAVADMAWGTLASAVAASAAHWAASRIG